MRTSSYEQQVINLLRRGHIRFEREKTFPDLRGGRYRYDFYLPQMNTLIEVNGEYHFKPIRGQKHLHQQQEHDRRKYAYALAHDYKLYAIPYWDMGKLTEVDHLFQDKFLVRSKWHDDYLRRKI